jgi:hypothetical protein
VLSRCQVPSQLTLLNTPEADWQAVVRIDSVRLQIWPGAESTGYETIEFDR